jgi:hypothetical protein
MPPYRDAVLSFLNRHPGPFCDPCLAEQLGLPILDVTMTTLNIEEQQTLGVSVDLGYCQRCRQMDRVTRKLA